MNFELIKIFAVARYGSLARHPLLEAVESGEKDAVAKRFCYSPKYSFTYLRIPKSANSTIVRTLLAHMPEINPSRNILLGRTRIAGRLRRLPTREQFNASYSFTFIRDPATRLLSAYLNKVCAPKIRQRYGLQDPANPDRPVSFSRFLGELEAGLLQRDLHWAPQSSMLPDRGEGFDFIGRVENFDTDIERVMVRIFGRFDGVERRTSGVTNAHDKIDEYVSTDDRRRIENLYAADYELYEKLV